MNTENQTTEFKREYTDNIKKSVIAFANCDGGDILIGVNNDGSICGVTDTDDTMLRVTNALRDAIRPDITMITDCRCETADGLPIIHIIVQRGTSRPYYLAGKGIRPEGVFVRQGASSVPATETAILGMIRETGGDSYEAARSLNQQLTFDYTKDFFERNHLQFGPEQMRTLHLIGDDGTYTNLAFLLSEQCTHTIKFAFFNGSTKSIFRDRHEFSGSLLAQLEEVFHHIDLCNYTRAEFSGLKRIDMRDYPPEAIREALLNAIVHRDYSYRTSTQICVFDDRIEFITIGGLIRGISMNDIELGISALRNPNLANIFYRLNLIEAYGTGIMKIRECYAEYAGKPLIQNSDNAFKVTLYNTNFEQDAHTSNRAHTGFGRDIASHHEPTDADRTAPHYSQYESSEWQSSAYNVREDINGYHVPARQDYEPMPAELRKNALIALCHRKDTISRRDVQSCLSVSQATAILLLRKLVEDGTLIKKGGGRNLRYCLSDKNL